MSERHGSAVVWAGVLAVEEADRAYEAAQRALHPKPRRRVAKRRVAKPAADMRRIIPPDYAIPEPVYASAQVVEPEPVIAAPTPTVAPPEPEPGVCVIHVSNHMFHLLTGIDVTEREAA